MASEAEERRAVVAACADKADRVVSNYSDDTDDLGEALSDLLGDLRHFADKHGLDFAERDRVGYRGYLLELGRRAPMADALDKLAAEIGYSDGADDDETGGVDALIDYKNALEDRCRSLERCLGEVGETLPTLDDWDGGPGRLEDIAASVDRCGLVPRPERSGYLRH